MRFNRLKEIENLFLEIIFTYGVRYLSSKCWDCFQGQMSSLDSEVLRKKF